MDTRKQLLETLMRDLADFKTPNRYTDEEKAEIKRGRKGQDKIDEGRRQIEANEKAFQDAVSQKADLQKRIDDLTTKIEQAERTARQESPGNQAAQYGKSLGIPAAGYAAGHVAGAKFGTSYDTPPKDVGKGAKGLAAQLRALDKKAPASKAQASAIVDTYDKTRAGRPLRQFVGPAALAGMSVATQAGAKYADDPTLKEGLNLAANAERYGAGGMALQQLFDTLRHSGQVQQAIDPNDAATVESARRQLNTGGKFDKVQGALDDTPEAPPKPPAAPAGKPAPKPGTVPALRAELEARGVKTTTKMRKPELEKALTKALRKVGKASPAIMPAAMGAGVYDALRSPAEAAEGEAPVEPVSRGAAAAAGAGTAAGAAGVIEGGRRLVGKAMDVPGLGTALRGLGRVAGPAAAGLTAYDAGSAILGGLAQGDDVAGADRALRQGNPSFHAGQDALARQAYDQQPEAAGDPELEGLAVAAEADPELNELLQGVLRERLAAAAEQDPMQTAIASQGAAQSDPSAMVAALRNLAMR